MRRLSGPWSPGLTALLFGLAWSVGSGGLGAPTAGAQGWPSDPAVNVAVSDTILEQSEQVILADGGGGAFFVWQDLRRNWRDRRVLRLNASGDVSAGWPEQGINLTQETQGSFGAVAVKSGSDAVILCWLENLSPITIRAQKVDTNGVRLWSLPGVVVNANPRNELSAAVAMPDGGVMVFYEKDLPFAVDTLYAMRLDASGQRMWQEDLVICDAVGEQDGLRALMSSDGNVILTWGDHRTTPSWFDPQEIEYYAQKLDPNGIELWGHNGIRILPAYGYSGYPRANFAGGFAAACNFAVPSERSDMKLVNIGGDGSPMPGWSADGVVIATDPLAREGGELSVSPSDGSLLLVWWDGVTQTRLKALKVSATGEVLWPNGGIPLYDTTAVIGWSMAPDGEGGAYVSIETPADDIIAQHVRADGSFAWPGWGVPVTTAPGLQYWSETAPDSSGGIFVCWLDNRDPATDPDLYAQHVNADGSLGGAVTAAAAAAVEAAVDGGCARVLWQTAEAAGVSFTIQRETTGNGWVTLGSASPDGSGRIAYRDCEVLPGGTYSYRLEWRSEGASGRTIPITLMIELEPRFHLAMPAPNPVRHETNLEFTLTRPSRVRLDVLDLAGRRVATPFEGTRSAGTHRLAWRTTDREGDPLAPGAYILRIVADGRSLTRRFFVVR